MNQTKQVKDQAPEEKSGREFYSEPMLEKRGKLINVTEGLGSPDPVST